MDIAQTAIPDVLILTPRRFPDGRGFFSESWNARRMAEAGLDIAFVQDNHSLSEQAGTVRGLHYQAPPHAQGKLVRCGRGALLDVAVDMRRGSPTYGRWVAEELSFENGRQLWIPEGFLHGFLTLEPMTEIIYKCTDFYSPESEGAVLWSSCGIDWNHAGEVFLSDKDAAAPPLAEWQSPFAYAEGAA
ncbi:dTDP-4-dehydrorhamnose 3,5-epimerase [Salipiger sp. P9]|uniref:dTDP-4-dehydrorhamnose 3,5-epimerase n=1 Tax=Salipiger pentaromativorans TaxID=2943193 RepID=UPI002157AA77|nr:dTDP-4-dehydrorhamnose 3,5-epimerase [Salipiger pentaromativorans]MCR8550901.1 dTDP-4-dehydrorhamnose 3,5-epimerase [Salipiger pentaromativorans]